MTSEQYILRGGRAGRERMRLLGRVMRPATLSLLDRVGVKPGMTCLDVGCGGGEVTCELARRAGREARVTGWDIDEIKLEIAREEAAAAGFGHVQFQQVDVRAAEIQPEFDLIYARFVLTHLAEPQQVLARLCNSLRPGGWLVLEDIDFRGHFCEPDAPALAQYIDLYSRAVRRHGGDPNIGPKLPGMFAAAGLEEVGMHVVQPAGFTGEVKLVNPITLEGIADSVIQDGLVSAEELRRLVDELYAMAHDPQTVVSIARVVQTWGRRASQQI